MTAGQFRPRPFQRLYCGFTGMPPLLYFGAVVLLISSFLTVASDSPDAVCDEEFVRVANTRPPQRQRDGDYRMLAAKRCRGKPIWKQQRPTNLNRTNYVFSYRSAGTASGWLIGLLPCSTEGSITVEGDTRCPCDSSLSGRWKEPGDVDWVLSPELTVQCPTNGRLGNSDGSSSGKDGGVTGPIIGSLLGVFAFGLIVVFIICCCLAVKKNTSNNNNTQRRTINIRVTDGEQSSGSATVHINTISGQTTTTETNIVCPIALYQLPPYDARRNNSNAAPPPSYSTVGPPASTTATASTVPSDSPPPTYEEVAGGAHSSCSGQTTTIQS